MDDEIRREAFSRYSFVNEVRKWEDMHTDCLVKIFEKVDIDSLIEYLPLVCKSWYKSTLDPQCWKILDFCYFDTKSSVRPPSQEFANYTSKVNCAKSKIKFAVNRSCGKASKVVFPSLFYDENILQYVLGGCAELKSLVLPYNYELSFYLQDDLKCIPTQIYKLKDLESLSLDGSCHVKEILTEIHTHCKKIVSLTVRDEISTEVASAIVTFVPNIKELVLSHCDLYREDLILILSGCRRLELLDVTHCKGFDAEDAEVVALASHIKIFRSLGSVAFKYYNFVTDGYHSDSDLGYVLAS